MKYSLYFRIWHWLHAFIILGLLATVFLRKTFLSWRTNSEILLNKLAEIDIEITASQAKVLAKAVRAGMWEWHIIFGYTLVVLIAFRIYLMFKDTSNRESFFDLTLHKKAVFLSYFFIYGTLIFMSISGFIIYFYQALGLLKTTAHDIKEIHELVFQVIMYFVPLHIIGVIIAENRDEKGLTSSMLHGKEL
ncbi:cytochrome b/b6 domain-containing protein [Sulfurimonas sp.]|uniref:cytochrome b/b6 domain-containing protein n=1 Tax=Sulfurimonas sp. TaxID=2022749 RepID=UPI002B472115|nr:cytochrome b/b6 domain-containing protein [Sulfurimonas sp.]